MIPDWDGRPGVVAYMLHHSPPTPHDVQTLRRIDQHMQHTMWGMPTVIVQHMNETFNMVRSAADGKLTALQAAAFTYTFHVRANERPL